MHQQQHRWATHLGGRRGDMHSDRAPRGHAQQQESKYLEEAAGTANLVARSQRDKLQRLIALEGIRSLCAALRHGDIGNWHARRQVLDARHSLYSVVLSLN